MKGNVGHQQQTAAAAAAFQKLELILFSTLVSVAIFVFQFPFWHRSLSLLSSIPQKDIFVSYFFFCFLFCLTLLYVSTTPRRLAFRFPPFFFSSQIYKLI